MRCDIFPRLAFIFRKKIHYESTSVTETLREPMLLLPMTDVMLTVIRPEVARKVDESDVKCDTTRGYRGLYSL